MKKIGRMSELAWLIGTALCAFGIALCTKAGLGLSMYAAPAYILHVRLHEMWPWLTQGTAQYLFDGAMVGVMCAVIFRFRVKYLLSFVYGVLFGTAIDLWLTVLGGGGQYATLLGQILAYVAGTATITLAIALMFRTYLPPQVPELVVVEVTKRFRMQQPKAKQILDFVCLAVSISMALLLTGKFTGIGVGTVVTALVNAPLIRIWGKVLDRFFSFEPMLPKVENFLNKL